MTIEVPSHTVPVLAESDVVVCGGGCSGVAVAVSAARRGASVTLLERWPSVGGMATNALVNGWHRSDREKMVIYGLVEETAQRAEKHGWIWRDGQYPRAHETHWCDPEGIRIVWQRMLDEAGVRTICNVMASASLVEGGRMKAVFVDTKTGRKAVTGRIFIDSTGDVDVAANAGVPFEFGRATDGRVQGMTMMYSLRGLDMEALRRSGKEVADAVIAKMERLRDEGKFPPFNVGNTRGLLRCGMCGPDRRLYWNMCPVAGNPLDEEELTKLSNLSREHIVAYLELWRREMPGYEKATIDQTGFALGIRESRRVKGLKTLDAEMVLRAQKHVDAVGHGVWMVDIHDPKGSGYTTYTDRNGRTMLREGTSYHIPLGMALNDRIPNLAVACRAASSTHEAHASIRVQTHLMALSQGVGTCAALALAASVDMVSVDVGRLQAALKADGVYLEDVPQE